MTRKDYKLIAEAVQQVRIGCTSIVAQAVITHVVIAMAAVFAKHNSRFVKHRFFEACGVPERYWHAK